MTIRNIFGILCFWLCSQMLCAQEVPTKDRKFHAFSITESYKYSDRTEWTKGGVKYQIWHNFNDDWGLQLSLEYVNFTDELVSSFPAMLGLHYNVFKGEKGILAVHGNAGVSGTVGSDFGGFFAIAETGIQYHNTSMKGLIFHLSWSQDALFHPSHFSYLKAGIGYAF